MNGTIRWTTIWLYNNLANQIVLHIELVNTISPDILPSKESIGSIKQAQILFRAIIVKKKFWCARMYYLVNYSVATLHIIHILLHFHL